MSSFLKRIAVKIGQQSKKNKFDLTSNHLTTLDFFEARPTYIKELVPNESIKIDMSCFTRLSPLIQPMLGDVKIVNRAFFVPMRTIWRPWNAFITDSTFYDNHSGLYSIPSHVPFVRNSTLNTFLLTSTAATTVYVETATTTTYDFVLDNGTTPKYYKYTSIGRKIITFLSSLGYQINWSVDSSYRYNDLTKMSALPLIAFYKIHYDWMRNPSYTQNIEAMFERGDGAEITVSDMISFSTSLSQVMYDADYFTSAWDNPSGPNSGAFSSINIEDTTLDGLDVTNKSMVRTTSANGTPVVARGDALGNLVNFSQYIDDALKSVTDYMKRHQLIGTRALERYASRFGKELSAEKLNRCNYIGKFDVNVQISDVMANTVAEGQPLGDYAGKGVGYGNSNNFINFSTDEYGYIMVISYVVPAHPGYVQGRDRGLQHLNKLDFFTPEFDCLGVQAIRNDELFAQVGSKGCATRMLKEPDGIFGYVPRYAEYKVGQDKMTGDLALPSSQNQYRSWHLNRMFVGKTNQYDDTLHNQGFTYGTLDGSQYNRVFSTDSDMSGYQKFIVNFLYKVESYIPAKQLFDNYEFDSEGATKLMQLGGTSVE